MIDYIKCNLECDHSSMGIGSNFIAKVSLAQLADNTDTTYGFYTGLEVKGKHNSKIRIRTLGDKANNRIEIEGNLAKFLQGHNLFGINDPVKLISLTIEKLITKNLGLKPTKTQLEDINNGFVKITKIDINRNFHLPSKTEADKWIVEAKDGMTMSYYGHVKQYNSTLYFGKGEKTKELKFYAKGNEIIDNKSLAESIQTPQLLEYANKMLRFEVRLNSKWLREKELSYARNWNEELVESLLDESLSRIILTGNMRLSDKKLLDLKPTLAATYYKWVEGYCLKDCLKPSTYSKHRRELLEHSIDISIVLPKFKKPTLDLAKVLTDNVIDIPEWAYKQELVVV